MARPTGAPVSTSAAAAPSPAMWAVDLRVGCLDPRACRDRRLSRASPTFDLASPSRVCVAASARNGRRGLADLRRNWRQKTGAALAGLLAWRTRATITGSGDEDAWSGPSRRRDQGRGGGGRESATTGRRPPAGDNPREKIIFSSSATSLPSRACASLNMWAQAARRRTARDLLLA